MSNRILIAIILIVNTTTVMSQKLYKINESGIGEMVLNRKITDLNIGTEIKFFEERTRYLYGCDLSRIFYVKKAFFSSFDQFHSISNVFLVTDQSFVIKAINIFFNDNPQMVYDELQASFGKNIAESHSNALEAESIKSLYWRSKNNDIKVLLRIPFSPLQEKPKLSNCLIIYSESVSETAGALIISEKQF